MALFNKKREEIPDLPSLPRMPEIPRTGFQEGTHELPSYISNSNTQKDDFNQELVKSAVTDVSDDETPRYSYQSEQEESVPIQNNLQNPLQQRQTIFVKVDKFNALQNALNEIQDQIKTLSKEVELLKEVKLKQIQEINDWDNEMKKINQRLTKIDSDIFGEI